MNADDSSPQGGLLKRNQTYKYSSDKEGIDGHGISPEILGCCATKQEVKHDRYDESNVIAMPVRRSRRESGEMTCNSHTIEGNSPVTTSINSSSVDYVYLSSDTVPAIFGHTDGFMRANARDESIYMQRMYGHIRAISHVTKHGHCIRNELRLADSLQAIGVHPSWNRAHYPFKGSPGNTPYVVIRTGYPVFIRS
jgi:hypothetical protein